MELYNPVTPGVRSRRVVTFDHPSTRMGGLRPSTNHNNLSTPSVVGGKPNGKATTQPRRVLGDISNSRLGVPLSVSKTTATTTTKKKPLAILEDDNDDNEVEPCLRHAPLSDLGVTFAQVEQCVQYFSNPSNHNYPASSHKPDEYDFDEFLLL
ncbi:hypothetical protein BASA81_007061 [Batrachochytrium salamandrivorans]|nr:hypothetical protein BASA81_007061 [Batrachochytrium salamandrivorans]